MQNSTIHSSGITLKHIAGNRMVGISKREGKVMGSRRATQGTSIVTIFFY